MKKRYLYSILFGVPGFFVSLLATFALFAVLAGFLWVFVYGDNPWPQSVDKRLPVLFAFSLLVPWVVSIIIGFRVGKNLEAKPGLDKQHIMISAAVTGLPIIFMLLHQLSVGNIGKKSDSQICSEYCSSKGYRASGMPPRNTGERSCFCLGEQGREAINVPLERVISGEQK